MWGRDGASGRRRTLGLGLGLWMLATPALAATGDQCLLLNPTRADLNCNGQLLVDEGLCLTWDLGVGYCSAEDGGYCDELVDVAPLDGLPAVCDDAAGLAVDADDDCIGDACDNCVGVANGDQSDIDQDGVGDACDRCASFDDHADADQDGVPDGCDVCPQGDDHADADHDQVADACDPCPNDNPDDPDSDGHCGLDTDVPADTDLPTDTDVHGDTDLPVDTGPDTDVVVDTDVPADTDTATDTDDTDVVVDTDAVDTDAVDTDPTDRGESYLNGGLGWAGCDTSTGTSPAPWLAALLFLARRRSGRGGVA